MLYPNVGHGSSLAMHFNQNSKDPVKRALLTDARFRKALSSAINREEINEVLYYGLQTPRQASFSSGSPFYDEEWSNAYIEYNPELANQLLDEVGLVWGDDGYRRNPDGSRVALFAEDADGGRVTELEMITAYWAAVGVQLHINTPERSLFEERTQQVNSISPFGPMTGHCGLMSSPVVGGRSRQWRLSLGSTVEQMVCDRW